jgi:hypothetical protein
MRRSIDEAFAALDMQLASWAVGRDGSRIRVFVYPPEWEPIMLDRFPMFASACANSGYPIVLVDIGHQFLQDMERRNVVMERLQAIEQSQPERVLSDLSALAARTVDRVLKDPLDPSAIGRVLINTGALGTFVSYSAIANGLVESVPRSIIAFPGEDDQRSLSLLGLRGDSSYRIPRI